MASAVQTLVQALIQGWLLQALAGPVASVVQTTVQVFVQGLFLEAWLVPVVPGGPDLGDDTR